MEASNQALPVVQLAKRVNAAGECNLQVKVWRFGSVTLEH